MNNDIHNDNKHDVSCVKDSENNNKNKNETSYNPIPVRTDVEHDLWEF